MSTTGTSHSEAVKSPLEKEQECLLLMKDVITQQLKILRAEAVTIERLMFAHSQPLGSEGRDEVEEEAQGDDGEGTDGAIYSYHDYTNMADTYLPGLSLEVELDHRRSLTDADMEEYDSDEAD